MKPIKSSKRVIINHTKPISDTKRMLICSIPYILFLVGVVVISLGFFRFIENESIMAIVLLDREKYVSNNSKLINFAENQPTQEPIISYNPEMTDSPMQTFSPIETPEPSVEESEKLVVPFYYIGDIIGTLSIPSVKIEVDVYQGDRESEFTLGAGHYPASYFPGQGSNILIAAHRTTYFKNLEPIEIGAKIHFLTEYGVFNYIVNEILIIDGNDNSVAGETSKEQLTLYTCYPFKYLGNAPKRFVVIAGLDGE